MKTDNELIAEFMGGRVAYISHGKKDIWVFPFREDEGGSDELLFHSSWDWLMPVVDKIDKTINETKWIRGVWIIQGLSITEKIDIVCKYVVDFIKWYNTQNQSTH